MTFKIASLLVVLSASALVACNGSQLETDDDVVLSSVTRGKKDREAGKQPPPADVIASASSSKSNGQLGPRFLPAPSNCGVSCEEHWLFACTSVCEFSCSNVEGSFTWLDVDGECLQAAYGAQ